MKIKTIATGSKGNCYVVEINDKYIIIDAGISFEQITANPEFPKFSKISFVFISHSHGDHNKSMKDFALSGCEMLTYKQLEPKVQHWEIDGFNCTTFPVAHNVPNFGLIVKCNETQETFCYVTDFNKLPKVEGVTNWLFEVNYIDKYIDEMIEEDKDLDHNSFLNHNSLENTVEYFNSLKTRPNEIVVCHTSKSHSIKSRILEAMLPLADKVSIAENWRK